MDASTPLHSVRGGKKHHRHSPLSDEPNVNEISESSTPLCVANRHEKSFQIHVCYFEMERFVEPHPPVQHEKPHRMNRRSLGKSV